MKLKNLLVGSVFFALIMPLLVQPLLAGEMTGREIIDRSRALEIVDDMQAEMEMEIIRGNRVRHRELIMSRYHGEDGVEKSLIRFTAPADIRGSGFLNITHADGEEESWLYLPAMGRERRIVSDERGGSFMGSDFTYEDIAQTVDDYDHKLLEILELNGREVYRVESVPISEDVARNVEFARRISYIDVEELYLHRAETYNNAGEMIRLLTGEDAAEIAPGLYLPRVMTMENLKDGGRTVLTYSEIEVNVGLSAAEFTRRQLTRPLN